MGVMVVSSVTTCRQARRPGDECSHIMNILKFEFKGDIRQLSNLTQSHGSRDQTNGSNRVYMTFPDFYRLGPAHYLLERPTQTFESYEPSKRLLVHQPTSSHSSNNFSTRNT